MNRGLFFPLRILGAALMLSVAAASFAGIDTDSKLMSGLVWRNIGPFRGGRIAAVSGAVGQPGVFYAGLPLGGVWKTTSAGMTWTPIFDDVKEASSVGAIEVAPSDPNVIYVGMGDMVTGGGINEGNGVYKSTDAGKTWAHLGLDNTKQIPSILVDPRDPNLVMVACQGNIHEQSEDRGLYRSTDGGKTWKKTLFINKQTGIQKIAWAYDNPKVMLATTVRHYNAPGAGGRRGAGGGGAGGAAGGDSGTHLYKSTDEGLTWHEIESEDLPDLAGRTCVAVAMNTNSKRMFLVANSGLYRSDDGGDSWRRMDAADRRVSNGQGGYNCGVYVDSKNPDIVYVINTCCYRSLDGGKTFTGFKGAPGGDDPQQMWIDPTNHLRLFLGTDQGATVSLDGGENWSSWYNQATAQVYHISVDNSYPYWVYATQQDSGAVATRSRGDLGEITPLDWLPTPGYEFGSIVPDPLNPKIVYSGGPARGIVKITYPNGQWINVSPNINSASALRQVSNQPLIWSKTNAHELFAGFQYLMATLDGGHTWKKLSPDLGYPKGVKPPAEGAARRRQQPPANGNPAARPGVRPPTTPPTKPPVAAGGAGATMHEDDEDNGGDDDDDNDPDQYDEMQGIQGQGGSIESIGPSSVNGSVIWVGTNNGLIKVTKNSGSTWADVTIPGLPNPTRADISAIDASHQDLGTAYIAIDYHTTGDYKPYFYRTNDFGKTWTKIVNGMRDDQPSGSFARVIRADTKRSGLLFAGTESSVYVSFDDGNRWQSLMFNLPNTSYRDMVVKDNDLVVGTYGRGFWVLDDISPLREMTPAIAMEPAHLFKPGDAIRVRRNTNGDTPFPPEIPHALNPPLGAIVYYYLGSKPAGDITLDVTDSQGRPVAHMSSAPVKQGPEAPPPVPDFWVEKVGPMPTDVGTNRINWNLRYDSPPSTSHSYEINANPGLTPASPEGPLVIPGDYTVTLTVDGKAYMQTVTVKNDPRSPATASALRAQHELQMKVYDGVKAAWEGRAAADEMKSQITACLGSNAPADVSKAANDFIAKLTAVAGAAGGGRRGFGGGGGGGGFGGFGGAAAAPSFMSVSGGLVREINTLDSGDMAPNDAQMKSCSAELDQLMKVEKSWSALNGKELVALNTMLKKNNLKEVAASTVLVIKSK